MLSHRTSACFCGRPSSEFSAHIRQETRLRARLEHLLRPETLECDSNILADVNPDQILVGHLWAGHANWYALP